MKNANNLVDKDIQCKENEILESYDKSISFNELQFVKSIKEEVPFISICIPLWEKDKWFDKLIKSIKDHDAGIDYEICVGEGHYSAIHNRNVAQKKAKSNYILQLDGDAEILHDGWLKMMYDTLMSNENIGIVGCIIEWPNGTVDHCGTIHIRDRSFVDKKIELFMPGHSEHFKQFFKERVDGNFTAQISYEKNKHLIDNKVYKVTQTSGVCFLYDKRNIGMWPEKAYKKAGWEDASMMQHCLECGYDIVTDGRVRLKHPNHVRTAEEHSWRDKEDSPRGFDASNFLNYMLRYGLM